MSESADAAVSEEQVCPFRSRCPMFDLFTSRSALRIYQINYCDAVYQRCKRYELAIESKMPDPRLLPDGDWLSE